VTKKILFALCFAELVFVQAGCFDTSPEGCEARELEDGSVVLVCGDDAPVTISGAEGEKGEPGEAGEAGEPGATTLLRVEDASTEQCMFGGTVVFSGADTDADGTLAASEEQGSFVVCQGVPGDATAPSIFTSDADAASCAEGGKQLDIGVDLDQSGTLEPDEITQNFTVCNGIAGTNGLSSLVEITIDGALGCAGDLVETGVDDDASGTLDMTEVDTSVEVCDGVDGLSSLVRVTEGAAVNCPDGGDVIEFGLDADGDNTLAMGEVSSSFEVCDGESGMDGADGMSGMNGMPGMNGYSALIRMTPEPGGVNCANGGQLIEVGIDNGDGAGTPSNNTLEAGEVDSSSYVCNGGSGMGGGKNALIRSSVEAPGANCADGGVKIETGLDVDDSGTLDAAEVDAAQTQYLCNSAYPIALTSSLGGLYSCAALSNGEIYCWGQNNNGQLGDGTIASRRNPTRVQGISDAVDVALGTSHTCAIIRGGTVECWGANTLGQLGNGTNTSSNTPVVVPGLTNAVEIGVGNAHTCARRANGTVQCWGRGLEGQLGNGANLSSNTPVVVTGIADATKLDAGFEHSCAISGAARDVRCWGKNTFGQLGDGTTTDQNTPVAVNTNADPITLISLGFGHSCAVTNLGTVYCWGINSNGQLGDGTNTANPSPALVGGLGDVNGIALGNAHTCALQVDGAVKCWGWNLVGQLGDGTTTDRLVPTPVFGIGTAFELSAGGSHSCSLLTSNQIKCWGDNSQGQLGDGTNMPSSIPVFTVF
jgi:alpha-tubulin suppressor-like RCC1 family protein